MFTGIIETTGKVLACRSVAGGRTLSVDAGVVASDAVDGASIAVNGVCLTVAAVKDTSLEFDVITETLERSNLGRLSVGDRVNLERSLRPDGRLDGHFVQGHVDGTAVVTARNVSEKEWVMWLRPTEDVRGYIIPKGSVCLDGISLTVAKVRGEEFSVAIIPTTLERTNLGDCKVGDSVNVESDIIARTVIHHLESMGSAGGLSMETLKEHGFL